MHHGPAEARLDVARRVAWRWAIGVLALGNLGHLLWGEHQRPSERYTLIKALCLLPLAVWGLRNRQITICGKPELRECIRLWPLRPARETLAGVAGGMALSAPVLVGRLLLPAVGCSVAFTSPTGFTLRGAIVRLTLSLPLTTVLPEEVIFRGVLQRRFERCWSPTGALLASSLSFSLWHLAACVQARGVPGFSGARPGVKALIVLSPLLGTLPAGLIFGWLEHHHRTLWAPMVAHWLAAAALLLDFSGDVRAAR